MGEQVAEALAASCEAQLASSQARLDACLAIKDKCVKSTLQIECLHMQFQVDQEMHAQQDHELSHDLMMMEKQLELECLKHGFAIQLDLDSCSW